MVNLRRALPWLGWSMIALIVVIGVGFWYLSAQRLRVDDENRRELSHVAHDLTSILTGLGSSAESYFKKADKRTSDSIREFARRNPYIERDPVLPNDVHPPKAPTICPALETPRRLALWPISNSSKDSLILNVNTEGIIDDVAVSDTFEYIFIADEKGKVMFAMEHGVADRHRDTVGWLDQHARENADQNHASIGVEDLHGLMTADGKDPKPIDPTALSQASATYRVRIGEVEYQLLTYPIKVPEKSCSNGQHAWIVGGLVDPVRMWREAATLSPRSTLTLLLLLLLGLAAEPFVKLRFLRPTERFRFADACMLLPNASLLLMGACVLLIEWGTHARLETLATGGLASLANQVEHNLTVEFRKMRAQTVEFDNELASQVKNGDCRFLPSAQDSTNLLTPNPGGSLLSPPKGYQDFSQVAWIDASGNQVYKATVHFKGTSRLNVGARTYFSAPRFRPANLWSFSPQGESGPFFFVESSRSMTTAELSTGLSIRSSLTCATGPKGPFVAAMSGPLLTMESPLLPAGYDFAVIAADGQVLYHSDRRRTLKEDLLAEIGDPESLHAAMRAGSSLHLKTTYGGRPSEIAVRPLSTLKGANWFLITMRDRAWLETVSTEALVRTLLWSLCSWLVTLVMGLVFLFSGRKTLRFWWPDPQKNSLYRALACAYGALLIAGVLFVSLRDPASPALFWLSLTFPLGLAAVTLAVYGVWTVAPLVAPARYRAPWYLAAIAGMWVAPSIVPAVGLFRHSWHLELDQLGRYEENRDEQYRADWLAEDRTIYDEKTQLGDVFFNARADRRPSYPKPLAEYFERWNWDQRLESYLPFYSEPVEALRLQHKAEGPRSRPFVGVGYERAWVELNKSSLAGFALVALLGGWWLLFHFRNLFWTQLDPASETPQELVAKHRFVFLLAPSPRDKAMWIRSLQPMAAAAAASGGSVAVTNKNLIDFENSAPADVLQRIEDAQRHSEMRLVILANSDLPGDVPAEEQERWSRALEPFARAVAPVVRNGAPATDGYFDSLWRRCSKYEQLTLIHVAEEGFANPRNAVAVTSLLDKGLLVRDPQLKLMDDRFENFVGGKALSPEVKKWERPEKGLGWRGARWILLAVLLCAVAFVAGTGETWIKSATAMTTALAGGLEAVWKFRNSAQRLISAQSE